MKIISHRAKFNGSFLSENSFEAINRTLDIGYEVEVDVWGDKEGCLALGHDQPEAKISETYLSNPRIWVHAKNQYALQVLYGTDINYFYHDKDSFTVTSKGFNWVHINSFSRINNAIYCAFTIEQLNKLKERIQFPMGVCTDLPLEASEIFRVH